MARRGEALTLGSDVYSRLRRDVLDGRIAPGERLKPAELRERFGVSIGVVREALTRLAEQRLVTREHNQGFHVAVLSPQGLTDITELRITVEALALRLSIERGDLQWESEVLAAHHRLARTPRRDPGAPDLMTDEWSAAHVAFHATLIEACAMPALVDICSGLSDTVELYRRWSAPAAGNRDVADEHQRLATAVLDRDAAGAAAVLREHYERTAAIVLDSGLLS